ncbi:MAG: hypothetical protein ACI3VR_05665 [Intestinibacter sp.]|uniref:hypothetical protein n=1 Tax=Intestinibacter sp. TaxID=1965304 RepID=UPI003F16B43A
MNKKNGFTTLECIISMSVLSIIIYMMTFSISNSFNLLDKNEDYLNMLNIAQSYLNEAKYDIKYSEEGEIDNQVFNVDNFQVNRKIVRQDNYYNCYQITLEVKSSDRSVKLESYVTKK